MRNLTKFKIELLAEVERRFKTTSYIMLSSAFSEKEFAKSVAEQFMDETKEAVIGPIICSVCHSLKIKPTVKSVRQYIQ